MHRAFAAFLVSLAAFPAFACAQNAAARTESMIRSAQSAAPASISAQATVTGLDGTVLREGSNGWVCMPDHPDIPNDSPMCLDAPWREFIDALMSKRAPRVAGIGIGYMLQGDMPVSNVDPYATAPTSDNEWVQNSGPHLMLIVADSGLLESLPADATSGGPWVMWRDTPYAHVMIPVPQLEQ